MKIDPIEELTRLVIPLEEEEEEDQVGVDVLYAVARSGSGRVVCHT